MATSYGGVFCYHRNRANVAPQGWRVELPQKASFFVVPFTLKPDFYLKLLEIYLNNKENIIELIESMEELIYQKKSK